MNFTWKAVLKVRCNVNRDFLNHFEPRQRSHVANLFLFSVRRGETEPHRIVSHVRHDVLAQTVRWKRTHEGFARNERIVTVIDTHFDEAVDFARWALWWESLHEQDKRRIKAERWMAQQPATEKQTKYLRWLGYDGEIQSKLQASELIDKLLKERRDFV